MLVQRTDVGAVGAAVHGAVEGVQARVGVLLLVGPLWRAAHVQDFGVVPLPSLAFPQLPGLGLDPDGAEESLKPCLTLNEDSQQI